VDQSQYVNNCPNGGQCGCTPADFAPILAQDPLVNTDTTANPLNFSSSLSNCGPTASSAAQCRYVAVPASPNSAVQASALLVGPQCTGCNRTTDSFTQTDANSTTTTFNQSDSETVGYSVRFGAGLGPSVTQSQSWTWMNSEGIGQINGNSNQLLMNLSSGTTGCYTDVLIYEDTIYHTFVGQLAPGTTTCP